MVPNNFMGLGKTNSNFISRNWLCDPSMFMVVNARDVVDSDHARAFKQDGRSKFLN
jgi:hypothetical protein